MNQEQPATEKKVICMSDLLKRYSLFSRSENATQISRGCIYKWRKTKGFPNPITNTPRSIWRMTDILAWEESQGYDFL